MKKQFQLILFTLFLTSLTPIQSQAQNKKQKDQIRSRSNSIRLVSLEQEFFQKSRNEKQLALQIAQQRGWKTRVTKPDGSVMELQRVVDGKPIYYTTTSYVAARSTRTNHLHNGGTLGLDLMGNDITVRVWDDGIARASHQEFDGPGGANRFSAGDDSDVTYHSTGTTGIMINHGAFNEAKGMAPHAKAVGYDWNNDLAEATAAARDGMLISNHSYAMSARDPNTGEVVAPQYFFGGYVRTSADWDELMFDAPYYLMVAGAGNAGEDNSFNDNPTGGVGFDKLSWMQTAKNNLVVANAQNAQVDASGNLVSSVAINTLSSQGPTDDFRIKPDITGYGTDLHISSSSGDDVYRIGPTGTSLASPNVAGSLLLLQEHFDNRNDSYMLSATLKGLALHTADDAGPSGPDAISGWGLLNAKKAAETISNNGDEAKIEELTLNNGSSYTTVVEADGSNPLMASISWTDRPGLPVTTVNSTVPVLVNDLDVRISQGNTTYRPYKLTGATTSEEMDNNVDPFERIDIPDASGIYTITVTHKGTLTGGNQNYSLIVTGIDHGETEVADATFEVDNIEYEVTGLNPNTVRAIGYTGTGTGSDLAIPPTITHGGNNFDVTSIGGHAFQGNELTNIDIPASVTSIKHNAFRGNDLSEVTIPDGVTEIGTFAFRENQLSSVTLGANVNHIGYGAFRYNNLTSVDIPNSVTNIGNEAFANNPNLALVTIERDSPPGIHDKTFSNANRDQIDLVVPRDRITAYRNGGWDKFKTYTVTPPQVDDLFIADHITYKITEITSNRQVSATGYSLTGGEVNIPPTVQCQGIDYTVTAIADNAFKEKQLTRVTFTPQSNVTSIGHNAFRNNDLDEVTIPSSVSYIGNYAFAYNQLTHVDLQEGLTSIGEGAFRDNDLNEVIIPSSVTSIGAIAFYSLISTSRFFSDSNPNLTTVEMRSTNPPLLSGSLHPFGSPDALGRIDLVVPPGRVSAYGGSSWTGFRSITEVAEVNDEFTADHITYKITEITSNRKVSATSYSLTGGEVTIPPTVQYQGIDYAVTAIGRDAFREKGLARVTLSNSVTSIGNSAFRGNELNSLIIPSTVTSIKTYAFYNNQLKSVTIPNSVTHIGIDAFRDNDLTEVTFADQSNMTSIGIGAFADNQLSSVAIPDGVTYIGVQAFRYNNLTSVDIPASVTSIGGYAFTNNQLTEVTLPNSVTGIGLAAFASNPNLGLVTVERDNPPTLDADVFSNANRDQIHLVVPRGALDAYNNLTNGWTGFKSITEVAEVDDEFTADHITYKITEITSNRQVSATNYDNTAGGPIVTIPPTVQYQGIDYAVTAIGQDAFKDNQLTSVTIPGNVQEIGEEAFANNPNLTQVTVERNDPPTLHADALQNANRDQIDVFVPRGDPAGSIKDTYEQAWGTDFKSITEVAGLNDAFTADHITYKITEITSNRRVSATGYNEAGGTMLSIPPTVQYQGIEYAVTAIADNAFKEKQLTSVAFTPQSNVTSIGPNAFKDNQLTRVTIPGNVQEIGEEAFANNPNLTQVTVERNDPPTLHADALQNANRDQIDVFVPRGDPAGSIKDTYEHEQAWGTDFKSITEVAGLNDAFTADHITYKITEITSQNRQVSATGYSLTGGEVNIPPTAQYQGIDYAVTAIADNAFKEKQLTRVVIPDGVTFIGNWAFHRNNLNEVTIPNGVTTIGNHAFAENSLNNVTIPNSVTHIEYAAFYDNQLESMTIGENVTSIGDFAFAGTNSITRIQALGRIPPDLDGIQAIQSRRQIDVFVPRGDPAGSIKDTYEHEQAWGTDFKSITEVAGLNDAFTADHITYKITEITSNRKVSATNYDNTAGGPSVTIPSTVQYEGIDYTVTTIGNNAFKEKELTEMTIPNSVESIGDNAFKDNQLTSVTIPGNVQEIGEEAFANNPDLTLVTMERSDPPTLHADAFQNANRDQIDVVVPRGNPPGSIKDDYEQAWGAGFKSITEVAEVNDLFIADHTTYKITEITSNRQVSATNYDNTAGDPIVDIPSTVQYQGIDYAVTAIGNNAFSIR